MEYKRKSTFPICRQILGLHSSFTNEEKANACEGNAKPRQLKAVKEHMKKIFKKNEIQKEKQNALPSVILKVNKQTNKTERKPKYKTLHSWPPVFVGSASTYSEDMEG